MALILINGLPGTGKTTACNELKARGFEAYDGDADRLAHWFDMDGVEVPRQVEERSVQFVASHVRTIARQTLEDLRAKSAESVIFVCNDPDAQDGIQDLFDTKFALVLDEPLRQERVRTRTNNFWGKLPHEREHTAKFVKLAPAMYSQFDYIQVNASQPVAKVVDEILSRLTIL